MIRLNSAFEGKTEIQMRIHKMAIFLEIGRQKIYNNQASIYHRQ